MVTDEVAELAEAARSKGATEAPAGEKREERPLVQKLLDSLKEAGAGESEDKSHPERCTSLRIYRRCRPRWSSGLKRVPSWTLPSSPSSTMVLAKQVTGGPEASESSGGGGGKRKSPKEVPDLAGWSTCFTLFQVAWASSKPEMWVPLATYRESIFKLAKRHQWNQVARYDRRFRQEAAGKDTVKWEEENLSLLLDVVHSTPSSKAEPRQSAGGGDPLGRKAEPRRKGACFRFNRGEGRCTFGAQCKFSHTCSNCGGDHPATQCNRPGERK